jgi:hypothetical protein
MLLSLFSSLHRIFIFFWWERVLEYEPRAYTLSHSTSPFFVLGFFKIGSRKLFAGLVLNYDTPDLCLLRLQELGLQAWATSTRHIHPFCK